MAFVLTASDAGQSYEVLQHPHWQLPIPAQGPAPVVPPGAEAITSLSAESCGLCHQPQFTDWSNSLHAAAMSAGLFGQIGAFDLATQKDCLTCHSPRQEMLELWLDKGIESSGEMAAVDCTSCHVRRHLKHGPRAISETPHGSVKELPLYGQSEFCAPCHQFDSTGLTVNGKPLENTYMEWLQSRYAREGITCQACHMPDKLHAFKGIHDRHTTRAGLSVRGWRTRHGIRVQAGNTGAGHALPTYVTPRILISLEGARGGPALEHVIARNMSWSREEGWVELSDDRLFPDQWITLELALPEKQEGLIKVHVEPDYDYHDRAYPALLRMLQDDLTIEEKLLLQQAREQSGTTAYSLYQFVCPEWSGHEGPCDEQP